MSHHIFYKITHNKTPTFRKFGNFCVSNKMSNGFLYAWACIDKVFVAHLILFFFPLFILSKAKTCKFKAAFPAANVVCPVA